MEVKIGIVNMTREIVVNTTASAEEISSSFREALANNTSWQITDDKGRLVVFQSAHIGYVDLGVEAVRPVGFGAV